MGCFHKRNMNMPQDPPRNWKFPAPSQDHYGAGQSILQVLVHPPHLPGRLPGDNDSDLEYVAPGGQRENSGQCHLPDQSRLPTPILVTFPSDFRKRSQLLNRYPSLKSEPSAEAPCGNTRAVGVSALLCGGLQPLKHSLTLGVWAVTPGGLFSVCV